MKIKVGVTWQSYGEYEIDVSDDSTLDDLEGIIFNTDYLPKHFSYVDDSLSLDVEGITVLNQELPYKLSQQLQR